MITSIYKSFAHFKVAIVGGGTGGVTLSGHLASRLSGGIALFQPHQKHLYQPAQTMVGGGIACSSHVQRSQEKMIPKGVQWHKNRVESVIPQNNQFISGGKIHTYQQLVLSTGVRCCFQDIHGAIQALQDPDCPVGSIYNLNYAIKFNNILSRINKGNFIFTQPVLPIKCAGAPQKIIHLSWDRLDKSRSQVKYYKAGGVVFGVPKYSASLQVLYNKKNVKVNLKQNLIQVRGKQRIAVFQNVDTKVRIQQKFDVLHLVPPQRPHSYISQSGLADSTGYLLVDNQTLRSKKYQNVWGLGDCTSTPNSKTAAAIMSQGPVLAQNILAVLQNRQPLAKYDGYASCPIFVGNKKLMLAEFLYGGKVDQTFGMVFDQGKQTYLFYLMKTMFFPFVYWQLLPRGRWLGRKGFKFI